MTDEKQTVRLEDYNISLEEKATLEAYFERGDKETQVFAKYVESNINSLRDTDTMGDLGAFSSEMIARDLMAREMAINVLRKIVASIKLHSTEKPKNKPTSYK